MKYFFVINLFCCVLSVRSAAQQLPTLSFYRHNWTLLNPAAMPREAIELRQVSTLLNFNWRRQQHIVSSQVPNVLDFRFEQILNRRGANEAYTKLGAFINSDNDGIIHTKNLSLNYARLMSLERRSSRTRKYNQSFGDLAIGGTLTYRNRMVNTNQVTWNNPTNFSPFQHNYLSLNAGVFWYANLPEVRKWSEQVINQPYEKKPYGYIGISATQAIQVGKTQYFQDVAHWNGITGVVWRRLEASTWVRYVPKIAYITGNENGNPLSIDMNLRYFYKFSGGNVNDKMGGNAVWFGGGLSSAKTANLELGVRYWLEKGHNSLTHYIQVGVAYSGFRLSDEAITRPSTIEVNVSMNFAQNGSSGKKRRRR